ncbi:hypothetical protein M441DRAFT_42139 [Trichoderma asperellum CBS 433.97]|uniref:Uncharacterized protein n=1 Tax=Trichoderma asperellum (strain ATCC 204424 / CBS 433.97 / NBRC 101777) TaxID=1042311 RepID=A0A2T3ZNG6_TRIA4|nr:hypothetical protein M441DRAFT_42139 [Trichoderma asperellum CBS 433.97]PTB46324.1 hypothetical protein M441DRAFT_42139 [Trichoderma asperellum CBS 433.97]
MAERDVCSKRRCRDGQGTSGVHAALTRRRMNDDISGILGWWPLLLLGSFRAAPIRGIHAYPTTYKNVYAQASARDLGETKGPCRGKHAGYSSIGRGDFGKITDVVDDSRLLPGDAAMLVWPRGRGKAITTIFFTDFQQNAVDSPFSANGHRDGQKA